MTSPTLTEIATIAQGRSKPNKKAIHQLIAELIRTGKIDAGYEDLADIYAWFMPPIPAKAKTPQDWVAKAMAKDDIRDYLNYLYSDGTRLIATDGHRLHLCPTDLPEGYYDAAGTSCDVGFTFPDVDRVIPALDGLLGLPVTESFPVEVNKFDMHCYRLPDGPLVQKSYLDAAINRESTGTIYYSPDDNGRAIRVHLGGDRLAVIMPVRED